MFESEQAKVLFRSIGNFLFLCLLVAIPVLVIRIDVMVLENNVTEQSMTEYTAQAMLAGAILAFVFAALFDVEFRRVGFCMAGFLGCLLVRELDFFFDDLVYKGFWAYPATLLALSTIVFALANRKETLEQSLDFVNDRTFGTWCLGLAVLLVFSRLFGMGYLWQDALEENYVRLAKNIAEEGTELLGYTIIFYAALNYLFSRVRQANRGLADYRPQRYSSKHTKTS